MNGQIGKELVKNGRVIMTEKRFTFAYETNNQYLIWWAVRDGDITLWKEEVVDLLNDLNDECNFLKIENESLEDGATRYAELYHKSLKENEELKSEIEKLSYTNEDLLEEKRIWKQMSDEYTKLSDENEQLKKELKWWKYKCGEDLND